MTARRDGHPLPLQSNTHIEMKDEEMAHNSAPQGPASAAPAAEPLSVMRQALERILDIEGYGAPWLEAKCIAQKALEGAQCTPPIAQETAKIEQPGNAAAMREALEDSLRFWNGISSRTRREENLRLEIDAALSAPARNCDRFTSWMRAWDGYIAEHPDARQETPFEIGRFHHWLFALAASAKEGGAK